MNRHRLVAAARNLPLNPLRSPPTHPPRRVQARDCAGGTFRTSWPKGLDWRRGWDSNPRAGKPDHLISSQRRYDRFGTSPWARILSPCRFDPRQKFPSCAPPSFPRKRESGDTSRPTTPDSGERLARPERPLRHRAARASIIIPGGNLSPCHAGKTPLQ